jgi:signal transduction histidine kinase/ligand-binding sensor domain-containing protein
MTCRGFIKYSGAYLCIVSLLASCNGDRKGAVDDMPLLYPVPQVIAFNPEAGYEVNHANGDSIRALVNSLGDTIRTGIPLHITGKAVPSDSVLTPLTFRAGEPVAVSANLNTKKVPETLEVIPVDTGRLRTLTIGDDSSRFVLRNSVGKILPTALPIPVTGKVVPCRQPEPVNALPPRMKDISSMNIKYLDVEQGMNSSFVLSILEDSHGNLWFGTGGGGVSMYDGETFTHYTEKEGLSNNQVWSILEDKNGNLWFGTWGGGVCMYNGEFFTHITEEEGLSNNRVRSIMTDRYGDLWFGTWGGGMSRYNGEAIMHLTEKDGLSNNYVQSMLEDHDGNLWFGTRDEGVSRFDGGTFTYFTEKDGLSDNNVLSILEDSRGNLWFGTREGGVNKYDGHTFTHLTEKEGLGSNEVNAIFEDSRGNLWFSTVGAGVSMYNGVTITHITEEQGLSNNNVKAIMEDNRGNLWFGTDYGGVSIYNSESFTHLTRKEGFGYGRVRSIFEDSKGRLWFGNWDGGLSMFDGEIIRFYDSQQGFTDDNVLAIFEDSHGNLWFGTESGGAILFDGRRFTHFTTREGLSSNNIRTILEDRDGNMWFGTYRGGASRYDGHSFTHFTEREGMNNNYVLSILEDSRNNLWFGTFGGGVSRYDGDTFMHFTEKEGLSNNNVMSLLEDSRGFLWFGTYGGGVNIYDGESIIQITENEGLSDNTVQSLLEDGDGHVWISTEKGLTMVIPGPDIFAGGRPVIHTFNLQDGLKGMDFLLNRAILDSRNRIWWGNSQSLVILDMNHFRIEDKPPAVQMSHIQINQQFADYRLLENNPKTTYKFDGVARYYNYPLNLELPYNDNHLTFHFSAIDWSAPYKVRYSYRMEGLNGNWSLPASEAKADYRSLAHGTYTLRVRAIGEAQKWSDPFEYKFTIDPPWWDTWWARACYILIILLIILGLLRWRTARLKQQHRELETEVANATIRIKEQKEEVESQRDEIVKTYEALEKQKRELELTLGNLKMTQSQLIQSEKMASVGVLTAGIAHELNNPINFVHASVNPLRRDMEDVFSIIKKYEDTVESLKLLDEFEDVQALKDKLDYYFLVTEIVKLLEGIEEGAIRSSKIIKGLRSFSRLDKEECQLYDIHEGIDSSLILLHNKIKKRIKVRKEYGNVGEIECYPSKLNQVILNILTNSIQAIEGKGEITIQTISSATIIKIIIKDTGKGISPEVKEHIFEPFFTTKDVGKGTGLGLSISYGIIEQHKGNIDVISEPGKGTEFIISLPKTQPV